MRYAKITREGVSLVYDRDNKLWDKDRNTGEVSVVRDFLKEDVVPGFGETVELFAEVPEGTCVVLPIQWRMV